MSKDQDEFLRTALGLDDAGEAPQVEADVEVESEAPEAPAADAEPTEPMPAGEASEAVTPAAGPSGLSDEDEAFTFQWLARAGLGRAKVNKLLDDDPELALALARSQKQAQDTIARARREAASERVDDPARPSDSARAQTGAPSPEETRRARVLQLVEDEFGEEERQALERDFAPRQEQSSRSGSAADVRLVTAVVATRERLIGSGHEELRDEANYLAVLKAADVLMAADSTLDVGAAIAEAAETLKDRAERRQAASQRTRRALAATQPTNGTMRPAPPTLTREQARDKWLDLRLAGREEDAEAVRRRYKL